MAPHESGARYVLQSLSVLLCNEVRRAGESRGKSRIRPEITFRLQRDQRATGPTCSHVLSALRLRLNS